MTLVEKCAREAAVELDAFYSQDARGQFTNSERVREGSKIILKHFAPVVEAQEKAKEALRMAYPCVKQYTATRRLVGQSLAALEAGK